MSARGDLGRPIRLVLFCGPFLERAAVEFVVRLEEHPEVDFLGGFAHGGSWGFLRRAADLWRRRRLVAVPILLVEGLRASGRFLFRPSRELAFLREARRVRHRLEGVPDIHAPEVLRRVRALEPDLGLIYGGPILRPDLFEIPRFGTLGIHHGRLPAYRGRKTTFWEMYHGEPVAGVTIQRVNAGLDTGEVVRAGEVRIAGRAYRKVWEHIQELGVALYMDAVLQVKRGTVTYRPPEGPQGPLYRRGPTPAQMLSYWWGRQRGPRRDREGSGPRACLLLETFHPEIGGGETQGRLLADSLQERGFEVQVVTRRSDRATRRTDSVDGVPIVRVPPAGHGRAKKWTLVASALPALARLRDRYDVILVCGFRILGVPALLAAAAFGKRCVLKADSRGEMSGEYFSAGLSALGLRPRSPPVRALLAVRDLILRRADAFVAMSGEIRREFLSGGIPEERIVTIPNCVDPARFRPAEGEEKRELREELGLPWGVPVVVYTGRFVSYKGLPLLLRAWRRLAARHSEARLLLVGEGGADMHNCEGELRSYVAEHGLGGSVTFTGAVGYPERYLRASDAFVFPTQDEAFGISLVEAMACGLPAVTTKVGGLADIVVDGETALVVAPGDLEGLRGSLEALLQDEELRARLGSGALRSSRRYGKDAVTEAYVDVLRRAARG